MAATGDTSSLLSFVSRVASVSTRDLLIWSWEVEKRDCSSIFNSLSSFHPQIMHHFIILSYHHVILSPLFNTLYNIITRSSKFILCSIIFMTSEGGCHASPIDRLYTPRQLANDPRNVLLLGHHVRALSSSSSSSSSSSYFPSWSTYLCRPGKPDWACGAKQNSWRRMETQLCPVDYLCSFKG